MSEETTVTNPSDKEQGNTPPAFSVVSAEQSLSAEDKMILYAALQDIANELRRINRERKKHHKERNHQ